MAIVSYLRFMASRTSGAELPFDIEALTETALVTAIPVHRNADK